MAAGGSANRLWAERIIGGLAASGVVAVILSPGSRSTPLALAALRHPGLDVHVLLDERAAAFFALGQAKARRAPVALVCTSGSAVANWHPAVIEADRGRVPLILISADRPPELLDCGANQVIDQARLFGSALRAYHALPPAGGDSGWLANLTAQAVLESLWPEPGPVQINAAFREPLLERGDADSTPSVPVTPPALVLPRLTPREDDLDRLARRIEGRRGAILCGPGASASASIAALAARLDVPVLADPLSGMRFGPHDRSRVMTAQDLFLRREGPVPDWVLRLGAAPVSKVLNQWASGAKDRWVVAPTGRWSDPNRDAGAMIVADEDALADGLAARVRVPAPPDWMASFHAAEAEALRAIGGQGPDEAGVIARLLELLPDNALLFVGNSMAIRDMDAFSGTSGKTITVMGNRGASGIDGNLATFLGAAASGRFSAALALVGDLTFLHDLGGLAAWKGDAAIAVLANDGGAIFEHLAVAGILPHEEFAQGWLTPQPADIAKASATFGCHHIRAVPGGAGAALAEALARPGVSVVEIVIDRDKSVRDHRALWSVLAQPLERSS